MKGKRGGNRGRSPKSKPCPGSKPGRKQPAGRRGRGRRNKGR